ncbi:hypothetical protein [Afipia sp. DC4300-2b1]|uniref:hypothetical protein n=1 Tax=Afipia sp. DC4300-2b1 TaxID=2804672 RepID=UPI003CFB9C88
MFFQRRLWAVRVIDRMGRFAGSKTSTALIELLIWASKTGAIEATPFGDRKRDQIIGWSIIMFNNPTATEKLAADARIPQREAYDMLLKMKQAGRAMAEENGLTTLVHIANESDRW